MMHPRSMESAVRFPLPLILFSFQGTDLWSCSVKIEYCGMSLWAGWFARRLR
jgi:hypothetical protein